MISRLILSVVVAVAVTLLCMLVGGLLVTLDIGVALVVGGFLEHYAVALGILAGLWYGFSGANWFHR